MSDARFIIGDTRAVTVTLPDNSIDLILTSPPFLALRSYLPDDHPDKDCEIGSEATPAAYIDVLFELVAEWDRVLAPHGSIAIELGDTYSGSGGAGGDYNPGGLRQGQNGFTGSAHRNRQPQPRQWSGGTGWPLAKSLTMIPELFRIGLAYGINPLTGDPSPAGRWRVRNVVRWHRTNPPVGRLGDKYRPATTDMVIACRSSKRWFDLDAVRTPFRRDDGNAEWGTGTPPKDTKRGLETRRNTHDGAPPLDTWIIPTSPYKGAHYATFPPELCKIPIESMCPHHVCQTCGEPQRRTEGDTWSDCGHNDLRRGIVFDPFGGSGTTLAVATGLGRDAIGIDIDERNADLAQARVGMFLTIEDHRKAAT